MSHELVIDVTTNTLLVDRERLHRELHPIERGRLPDKVGRKVVRAVARDPVVASELQCNLVRYVCGASARDGGRR